MSTHYPRLIEFFKELKRRKVIRVITVYAASAFVILELVDILAPALSLPDWTLNLVLLLLCVGFVIAVIVSWIYDIHPDEGIVKTEPADKVKPEDITKSSNSWKIASYISFAVIIGLVVLNIIPRANTKKEVLEKSIAVLPFRNDSPDESKMYFINGTMEAILDNLCKIEDLRVPGRTSVEQYRDNPQPITTVAEEMNVSYVLEGSGHRDGTNVRLVIQLLDGKKDQHLWSKTYDADIEEIFSMQSEIAKLVATEVKAIITPEEKQLIEKTPTSSVSAYDYYLRGREEHWKALLDRENREALESAEEYYHRALVYDSTFAQAYAGLGWIYWYRNYYSDFFSQTYLDSSLILADLALTYDNQLDLAFVIRGIYYWAMGKQGQAIEELEKALRYNPNCWEAYTYLGTVYYNIDPGKAISNYKKAALINRGQELPVLLRALGAALYNSGFIDEAKSCFSEVLNLDEDSVSYYKMLALMEERLGNYAKSIDYSNRVLSLDPDDVTTLTRLIYNYLFSGQYAEALQYIEEWLAKNPEDGDPWRVGMHRLGYVYFKTGNKKKAEVYFNKRLEDLRRALEMDRSSTAIGWVNYDMAAMYAFMGDRIQAYDYLRIFNKRDWYPIWMVTLIKDDPLFDSIRDDSEFQQIVSDVETKFQAEHERIRQWLEENDML